LTGFCYTKSRKFLVESGLTSQPYIVASTPSATFIVVSSRQKAFSIEIKRFFNEPALFSLSLALLFCHRSAGGVGGLLGLTFIHIFFRERIKAFVGALLFFSLVGNGKSFLEAAGTVHDDSVAVAASKKKVAPSESLPREVDLLLLLRGTKSREVT